MKTTFVSASCILLATSAFAQDTSFIGTVYTTSQARPVAADRTGAPAYRLDGQSLQNTQTLPETLQKVPGLQITPSGGPGQTAGFMLRGALSRYVPVYIDGIEVTDPAAPTPSFNIGQALSGSFSSIEVLAGAQSALYGNRALGGVIALETPKATAEGLAQTLSFEAGSYATTALSYGLRYSDDANALALSLGTQKSDGFSARLDNTEKDGFDGQFATLSYSRFLQDGSEIGGSAFVSDTRADYDNSLGSPFGTYYTPRTAGLRLFSRFDAGSLSHEIAASHFEQDRDNTSSGSTSNYSGNRDQLSWKASGSLSPALAIDFGADATFEDFSADATEGESTLHGAFVELAYAPLETLDYAVSLRRDEHDAFGGLTSARMAAAWRPSADWTLRAQAGSGFRAPSNYELYDATFGNPDLQPEEAHSFEFGAERRFANESWLRATYFSFEIENQIGYDSAWRSAQTDDTSKRKGVEVSGLYTLSDRLSFWGNYTYTDTQDSAPNSYVSYSRHLANWGLDATFGESTVGLTVSQAAGRQNGLENYTLLGATFRTPLTKGIEASLRLENITDADYVYTEGYSTAGRSAYVGLRAAF